MALVLAGKFNKVIADELNISMRTVEVHRAKLFEKMGSRTAVELSQLMSGQPPAPKFEPMRHASDPPALAQPVLDALLQVDIGLLVICR